MRRERRTWEGHGVKSGEIKLESGCTRARELGDGVKGRDGITMADRVQLLMMTKFGEWTPQ